jgi:hypothetical protein
MLGAMFRSCIDIAIATRDAELLASDGIAVAGGGSASRGSGEGQEQWLQA